MKAFVIFPTICVFILTLTLVRWNGQLKQNSALLLTTISTCFFGGLMIWFAYEAFQFLYYANFVGIVVCIPCITYLANKLFRKNSNKWIYGARMLGLGLASTALTIVVAGLLIYFSFLKNPTDPVTNKKQTIGR
jgi:hypothetical protein